MPLYVKGKSLEYISSYTTDRYAAEQTHVAANNQKEAPPASVDGDSARAYRVCGNTAAHCYSALRCYAHTYARPVRIG